MLSSRCLRLSLAPIFIAALAACGGGGGGDGGSSTPAATGDFAAGSYSSTADGVVGSVMTALNFDPTAGAGLPLGAPTAHAQGLAAAGVLPNGRFERLLAERALSRSVGVSAQATDTTTTACSGGGQLVFVSSYANAEAVNKGDRVDVSSNGCIENGLPVSGTLALVVSSYSASSSAVSAALSITAGAFGSSELRVNGSMTLSISATQTQSTVTLAYQAMTAQTPAVTYQWDHSIAFTATQSQETLAFGGLAHGAGGATYTLRQDVPFVVTGTGVPAAGQLSIIDKDGDRVQLNVESGGFTYTFYTAGSSTPTAGPVPGWRFESVPQ